MPRTVLVLQIELSSDIAVTDVVSHVSMFGHSGNRFPSSVTMIV